MKPNGPFRGALYIAIPALILWILIIAGIVLAARSDAAPACEVRSAAHVAEAGGLAADNSWHIAHGQLPTCGEPERAAPRYEEHDNDEKSRYCKRKWFC